VRENKREFILKKETAFCSAKDIYWRKETGCHICFQDEFSTGIKQRICVKYKNGPGSNKRENLCMHTVC